MKEHRWITKLAARVILNGLAGGALFAVVGAFCIGLAGGIVGTVLDYFSVAGGGNAFIGAYIGFGLGALSGVCGVIIFGIAAFKIPSHRGLAPLRFLAARVIVGQVVGTIGAVTFFLFVETAKTRALGQPLSQGISEDLLWILFGAPILMICGAIAGALSQRETRQSATLKAE